MEIQQIVQWLLWLIATVFLLQLFYYKFQEHNRSTIMMGVVYLFLSFALHKMDGALGWVLLGLPLVGVFGIITSLKDSFKPNWLNYLMIVLQLALFAATIKWFYF